MVGGRSFGKAWNSSLATLCKSSLRGCVCMWVCMDVDAVHRLSKDVVLHNTTCRNGNEWIHQVWDTVCDIHTYGICRANIWRAVDFSSVFRKTIRGALTVAQHLQGPSQVATVPVGTQRSPCLLPLLPFHTNLLNFASSLAPQTLSRSLRFVEGSRSVSANSEGI